MSRVGVVICNYNKKDMVAECINCIRDSKYRDYDLFVVDNASTDGAAEMLRKLSGITLIENPENLGGSGGFNAGLRAAYGKGYEYLCCIDNDCMLDENALGELVSFLDNHPETGIAASKIYHLEDPDRIQQFGQDIDFDFFCTEVPDLNRLEDGTDPAFKYVDSVAACSLMVRRSVIDKIGFLPEENFLYWDDTEWCYACNQAGFKVASVGTSQALHAMGAKKEAVNTFPTYYAWRNWIKFFAAHTPIEKQEKMVETFLSSAFDEVYCDLHKGERNKSKTVMLAFDDAIHGITGKAGRDRIFDLDRNPEPFKRLFDSEASLYLNVNEFPSLGEKIKALADKLCPGQVTWASEPGKGVKEICLVESIFKVEDLSLNKVYIDIDECILQSEDDVLNVINYPFAKRAFIYAQKPVFMQALKEHFGGRG